MAYEDSPEVALERIMRKSERALKRTVYKLHTDLIKAAPVDTGSFKIAWKVREENPQKFYITNAMEYTSILWRGRRPFPNGKGKMQMYGSKQWPEGGDPMLAKSNIALQKQLDAIKE